jgi:hypothetical protein
MRRYGRAKITYYPNPNGSIQEHCVV